MKDFNRRRFLEGTAGVAATTALAAPPSGRPPCTRRP